MFPTPPGSRCDGAPEASGAGASSASANGGRATVRRIASSELLGASTELVIVHGQREYRLRVTSNGKLILTA